MNDRGSDAPFIDRKLGLNLMGDWGLANLHRICGWLASQVMAHSAAGTKVAIWSTTTAGVESVEAVAEGEVDFAMSVPAHSVANALDGRGVYNGRTFPDIRSLGTMPQTDVLILAVDAALGVRSFDEIRAKKPALRISTSPDDGKNPIGYAVHRLLEVADTPRSEIEAWGGGFVEGGAPDQCCLAVRDGRANAIFFEGIMTPYWRNLAHDFDLSFIQLEDKVLDRLEESYGWPRRILEAGRLDGQDEPLVGIEWSDFLTVVRDDFPDDLAYLMAWAMCNTSEFLERQYRHLPVEHSPVTYPLDPKKICRTAIPLHPGAERYYREAGAL